MILLNLTAVPLILMYLAAAPLANVSLPAPPASDVAAFYPNGTPVPTWVVGGRLYVLQAGEPAVAVYVPQHQRRDGLVTLAVAADELYIQLPPGSMLESPTDLEVVAVNRSGIYLRARGSLTIAYRLFAVTQVDSSRGATASPSPPPPQPTAPPGGPPAYLPALAAAAAAAGVAAALALRRARGRGGCGGLGEVDRRILEFLEARGGSAYRRELAGLGIPSTTLHKHLHKLARYGYLRLVTDERGQLVRLARRC